MQKTLARVVNNGRIAEPRRAMKAYTCDECKQAIEKGEDYYAVTIACGGLGSLKFPKRVHADCINSFLGGSANGLSA